MKNAEAAISSRRGGVKSLRTGGEVKKIFGLGGGGLPIWVGGTFAGEGQYPITCHGNFNFYLSFSNALHQKH